MNPDAQKIILRPAICEEARVSSPLDTIYCYFDEGKWLGKWMCPTCKKHTNYLPGETYTKREPHDEDRSLSLYSVRKCVKTYNCPRAVFYTREPTYADQEKEEQEKIDWYHAQIQHSTGYLSALAELRKR